MKSDRRSLVPAAAVMVLATGFLAAAAADTLVTTRTLRAGTVLTAADVAVLAGEGPLDLPPEAAIGQETTVAIYEGRALRAADIGPPTLVARNQTVTLRYSRGALVIETAGRALARGGEGDAVRAINLASRTTVTGTVLADGTVMVPATH